jgi:hypothetical protein
MEIQNFMYCKCHASTFTSQSFLFLIKTIFKKDGSIDQRRLRTYVNGVVVEEVEEEAPRKEKKAKEIAEGFASKHKDAGNNSKPSKPKDAAGSKGVKTETIRTAKEPREQREQREWREAKQLMDGQHQNVSMWVTHELLLYILPS